jgi:hypothetical protein
VTPAVIHPSIIPHLCKLSLGLSYGDGILIIVGKVGFIPLVLKEVKDKEMQAVIDAARKDGVSLSCPPSQLPWRGGA